MYRVVGEFHNEWHGVSLSLFPPFMWQEAASIFLSIRIWAEYWVSEHAQEREEQPLYVWERGTVWGRENRKHVWKTMSTNVFAWLIFTTFIVKGPTLFYSGLLLCYCVCVRHDNVQLIHFLVLFPSWHQQYRRPLVTSLYLQQLSVCDAHQEEANHTRTV